MAASRTTNVIMNSGASVIFKIVQIFTKFLIRTLFIKLLGNEYTGISSLFADVLNVLSLLEMGLDSSLVFSLYKPLAHKDTKKVSALLNFYKKAFSLIGIGVFAAGVALLPFLEYIVTDVPNIHEDIRWIFMMYVITSASSYFFVYKSVLMRADQKSRVISVLSAVVNIAECIAEIVFLLITREFFAYLIIHFLATVIRSFLLSRKAETMYPEYFANRKQQIDKSERNHLLKIIAALCIYNMSAVILNSADSIFISAFVGTVQVTIIGNFTLITTNVTSALQLVINAMRPSVGNLAATASLEREYSLFKQINFITFWTACVCSTCLLCLLNPFIGEVWFDASYKTEVYIIALLVVSFYITMMSSVIGTFRSVHGVYLQGWFSPALMSFVNIILNYFMGRKWGITGIYLATVISLVSIQVWFDAYIVHKHVFHKKVWGYLKEYATYAIVTIASCAFSYAITNMMNVPNVYVGFLCKAVTAAIIPNIFIVLLFRHTAEFGYVTQKASDIAGKLFRKNK